jgi:hypothetical protein
MDLFLLALRNYKLADSESAVPSISAFTSLHMMAAICDTLVHRRDHHNGSTAVSSTTILTLKITT